ncbi:MAG: hypothetical protein JXD19_02670 [Deltaproteobacteria bacterium]|nr:hypothetical protein [Deltaproteobacteria bacterium]
MTSITEGMDVEMCLLIADTTRWYLTRDGMVAECKEVGVPPVEKNARVTVPNRCRGIGCI